MPFSADHFPDYELLDCGNGQKYERFGRLKLIRPETLAIWSPGKKVDEWKKDCDAQFVFDSKGKGHWESKSHVQDWTMFFPLADTKIAFELRLTKFKHIGIFPEHAANWKYIYKHTEKGSRVLNLFAYTGGASLAARAKGASVTHVDSIKQVVAWGKKNMELSSQQDIRWIVEDAQKFVQREARRGNTYDMIIMDPPSFGQGTKGEKWKLEDKLNDLLSDINKISNPSTKWIVNTYSGLSPVMLTNLVREHRSAAPIDCQEIVIRSKSGTSLPLGTVARVG